MRIRTGVAAAIVAASLAPGFVGATRAEAGARRTPACARPAVQQLPAPAAIEPYRSAVASAAGHGLQVWLESDLVRRWWAGQASFDAGVQRLAELARDPSVVGFKIADELGYGDVLQAHPECVLAFVADAVMALHTVAPHAQVLVDLVVPDLGCAPGLASVSRRSASCRAANDARYPALTLSAVDRLVSMRSLDVIDLSTGLLDPSTYTGWGITATDAQQAAWREVNRRGWADRVALNARKALAHPGSYPGSAATAAADTDLFVATPVRLGARAVDVWTWRQTYQGDTFRLADPGLRPNALWDALVALHDQGVVLLTHFSPNSVESGVDTDLAMLSQAFSGVFVAAGTG